VNPLRIRLANIPTLPQGARSPPIEGFWGLLICQQSEPDLEREGLLTNQCRVF
jgi:hypothetical protein